MAEMSLKLQLDSIEHQLKILKAKMLKQSPSKKMPELYGSFEGQLNFSQDEIKKYEYPIYHKV